MPASVSVLPQHPVKGSVSVTLTAHKIEETKMTDYAPTTITELKPFDGFTSFTAVVTLPNRRTYSVAGTFDDGFQPKAKCGMMDFQRAFKLGGATIKNPNGYGRKRVSASAYKVRAKLQSAVIKALVFEQIVTPDFS